MIVVKKFLLRTQVTVPESWRALVLVNGKYHSILRPGRYTLPNFRKAVAVEGYSLATRYFTGTHEQALLRERPDLADEHLTDVRTAASEVAVVSCDGKLFGVLKPDARHLFWTDAGPWSVEKIDVSARLDVPDTLAKRLAALGPSDRVKWFGVEDGQVGLLYIDNAFVRVVGAGNHAFWNVGRAVSVKIVDTRQTALDVTGQEVLTRDKVSIRVNLAAKYTVVDPVKAVNTVKDFADALYRALQHAFRQSLATKTLDDILPARGRLTARRQARCVPKWRQSALRWATSPSRM